MTDSSRTSKSIRNSKVALIYTFFNSILSFFSRKIFLDHLGTEILGLNTTAVNILQFLNLAELGIGTAVTFTIYKPLFEKDYESVNEIVSVQGWLYRRIAWWMIGGALVAMCLFPFIFNKMELPLWYAYASFGVLLVSSLLGYFVNYKQIILSADQCEYAITYSYKGTLIVKTFCQMAAVYYFPNGYLWWLILEFVFAFVASWRLNQTIRKRAPFLHSSVSLGRKIKGKYPDIIIKIKQLFFHKISGFILTEVTPLIIYGYANLALVPLYGNYLVIISGVKLAVSSVFDSIGASVGNLVAEGDSPKIMTVFNELFSSRFLFITTACFCLYILTPEFVTLWIGPQYVLSNSTLLLMILTLYIRCRKTTVDVYLNAYGLFNDIWAPITEACLNIDIIRLFLGIKRYFSRSISESVHRTFVLETLFPFLQRVARAYNNLYTNLCKTYFSRSNRYGSDSMDFQFYPFPEERTFFRISAACCNYLLDIFFASIDRTFLFHRWYARFCCQNSKNNKLI